MDDSTKSETAELRRTIEQLRQGEERMRLMVEAVRDYAIFMLDPRGIITSWNSGAERLKGYKAQEVIGKSFEIFYGEADRARGHPADELKIAIREGRYEEQGWRFRKDGTQFWANVVITALFDSTGSHIGFTKVTRDFTERRAAEERLRESEERLRLLVESVKDYAIFMLEPDGRIATWNTGAQRLKGYDAEEIIGQHFSVFYSDADRLRGHPEEELRRARADGRYEEEGWRIRKTGDRFWANVVITPVYDANQTLVGYAKVTRDLTERRRIELEARAAERDAAVARALATEAQDAVRMRDEFLAVAAHELRTPLTALQLKLESAADMIRRAGPRAAEQLPKHLERTEGAVRQARRLGELVERLLDVSRIMAGRLVMHAEETDLAQLIREVVEDFRMQAQQAGSELKLTGPESLKGMWDRPRIEQVVLNLVSNAIKYGASKPIDVELEPTAAGALVRITDRGIGISAQDRERIFGRFERAVPVQNYGGLGLGLYVSSNIVRAHGGTITVTSSPGSGSTFTMDLPSRPDLVSKESS